MDMVDVDTLQALLESFGQVCNMGAGIFTPGGTRIGWPANHSPFCSLLYTTAKGKAACLRCDQKKIRDILRRGKIAAPRAYKCHAGLIDFCEPIYCQVGGKRRLIGVFFAGQVLYEDKEITDESISDLRKIAVKYKIDPNKLEAKYMEAPRVSRKRVREARAWMRQFTKLIGLLVERKAETQQLLLAVIGSANDPNTVVRSIQDHLRPASVSIFLKRDNVPKKFADRIFLVATTSKELASRLPVEADLDKVSYKRREGLTGWVYATGRVLHAPDIRNKKCYPRFPCRPEWKHKVKEIADWTWSHSFLGAPIRSDKGKVIGVIRAIRLKGESKFRQDEIELLSGIASLVGAAASKARLYKEHGEKIEVLNQAQGLLEKLTEPGTSLDSITKNMVEQLGHTYVKKDKWEAVYVLQHLKSSEQFRFVATYPPNLRKEFRGEPFPDTEGVSGYILHKTKRTFASANCARDGVRPTTPWTSVVCAPIFHKDKMWGAVSLCCEHELSQTDVDLATPKITQFANDMSLVCRLSEILDAKNTAALVASNVLSLNLEAHEVYKSLESSKITVDHLFAQVAGEEKIIVEDLAKHIDDSLSWADVCLDLGRYIKLCQIEPNTAIQTFRDRHIPRKKHGITFYTTGYPWREVRINKVGQKALNSVQGLIGRLKTDVRARIMDGGVIVGDENLLYRAFRNLLENAIVHGSRIPGKVPTFRKGLKVFFSVTRDSRTGITKIIIRDKGVGMNPKILAASKEIYADPTLLRSTSFAPGFGTTIVAFAISAHLGSISLNSGSNKGTQVCVQLPTNKKIGRMR
jgi:ligand-binding sensor protein/GAF domain-containing protein